MRNQDLFDSFGARVSDHTGTPAVLLDRSFCIRAVNAEYERATLRNRSELVGENIFEAFPDNPHDPHANGNEKAVGVLRNRVADEVDRGHRKALLDENEQLRRALETRDTIGQAKGILMERFNTDATRAFEILVKLSQESNTRVADLAHKLVKVEHPPQL